MNNNPSQVATSQVKNTKSNKLILVAEDDDFYANIYKVKLTKEGFDVVIARDGEMALKAARDRKPDLILLDLIMPNMDGFEALKHIRLDPSLKDIKVIALSNLGQEEDIKKVRDLGANDYMIKTNVPLAEVINKVKEFTK